MQAPSKFEGPKYLAFKQLVQGVLEDADKKLATSPMSPHERRVFGIVLPRPDARQLTMQPTLQPSITSTTNAYLRAMQTFISKEEQVCSPSAPSWCVWDGGG